MLKKLLFQTSQSLVSIPKQPFSLASLVKQLREETGSPMLQCKKALEENNNDFEQAKEYLKQKGLSRAQKYQQKETREGLVGMRIAEDSQNAAMLELNCQTDFVARTESFQGFASIFLDSLIQNNKGNTIVANGEEEVARYTQGNKLVEQVLPQASQESSIHEVQQHLIAHLQENINMRRFSHLSTNEGIFGAYVHNSLARSLGLKSCLVELSLAQADSVVGDGEKLRAVRELADNLALQILGNKPKYLVKEDIPADILEAEITAVRSSFGDKLQSKPEKVQKNMVEGKMKKFYEDNVLYSQPFIFDEEDNARTIQQYIAEIEKTVGDSIKIKSYQQWTCE